MLRVRIRDNLAFLTFEMTLECLSEMVGEFRWNCVPDLRGHPSPGTDELEVVGHEVRRVDLQVVVDMEVRNVGNESTISLGNHGYDVGVFDAADNDILRDYGTRAPEDYTGPDETGVVEVFITPEVENRPARYEITINCDVRANQFNYCEDE